MGKGIKVHFGYVVTALLGRNMFYLRRKYVCVRATSMSVAALYVRLQGAVTAVWVVHRAGGAVLHEENVYWKIFFEKKPQRTHVSNGFAIDALAVVSLELRMVFFRTWQCIQRVDLSWSSQFQPGILLQGKSPRHWCRRRDSRWRRSRAWPGWAQGSQRCSRRRRRPAGPGCRQSLEDIP